MAGSFEWLRQGTGVAPRVSWAFTTDADLVGMTLAAEAGHLFVADKSGGMYRLNRAGRIQTISRGLREVREFCFSDLGDAGIAVCGKDEFCALDGKLDVAWSAEAPSTILGAAIDSYGHNVALSFDNGHTALLNLDRKKLAEFTTVRPLDFLKFAVGKPRLIGAAEHGLLSCHRLDGSEMWNEKLTSSVGDLTVAENGRVIFVAGYAQGVQSFDGHGNSQASYVVEGTPSHVSVSHFGERLSVATVEQQIYWMDADGTLLWATDAPEPVMSIVTDPLGEAMFLGLASGRVLRLDWDQ